MSQLPRRSAQCCWGLGSVTRGLSLIAVTWQARLWIEEVQYQIDSYEEFLRERD